MKHLLLASLLCFASSASFGSIITYSYEFSAVNVSEMLEPDYPVYEGTGLITLDTDRRVLLHADLETEVFAFAAHGEYPIPVEEPWEVSGPRSVYFLYFQVENASFGWELYADDSADPLEHLEFVGEEHTDISFSGARYEIGGIHPSRFVKISVEPSEVPEPSTMTLFGLGLLGFAAKRRHS